jgi:Ni,Fe-hydrogenase III component G
MANLDKYETCGKWGKSDQKMIVITNNIFDELYEHLQNDNWRIESISACSHANSMAYAYCYVLLQRN